MIIVQTKEHAVIDVKSGIVLSTCVSKASEHNTNYFQYAVVGQFNPYRLDSLFTNHSFPLLTRIAPDYEAENNHLDIRRHLD